ncbi:MULTISPECIES: DUF3347 domain-containing protein [Sphingobacterium]|uniref:DUF3347 domain-containing protein n=1 Tax=Sphingobacterium TaxID=28453 RepID=UPI0013D97746|nr:MULTISPECIES: DUF3347 domain-containing protein [unclassified Sphingobacterium]
MNANYFWISISSIILSTTTISAQVKNSKTETFHVNGNCGMCKATIEKAGNKNKESQVTWDAATQSANISYDAKKTSADAILKRIALAGYDNEKYLAPDDTYAKLHGCCQYDRTLKSKEVAPIKSQHAAHSPKQHHDHTQINMDKQNTIKASNGKGIETIITPYFDLKNAFVNSDSKAAATQAKKMLTNIEALKMESLTNEAHQVWMSNKKEISTYATKISTSQDIASQRQYFATLSLKVYALIKASPLDKPVYYQNCPMYNEGKGANWLSLEQNIKNPYYGSKMMTCGSVKEKID